MDRPAPSEHDQLSSLHRLYLVCEQERDSAVRELDDATVLLAASEAKRHALSAENARLTEELAVSESKLRAEKDRIAGRLSELAEITHPDMLDRRRNVMFDAARTARNG